MTSAPHACAGLSAEARSRARARSPNIAPPATSPIGWRRAAHWIALSAVPSGLMLSTTLHLTTDIAAMPLLGVVPLAVYLMSVTVAFSERRWLARLAVAGAALTLASVILREEIAHVAAGSRWFRWYCGRAGVEPGPRFRELLAEYARAVLYGPFNYDARSAAGFDDEELEALRRFDAA